MGTVYLATDTRLDRRVALKVCHRADSPQALERFKREAAILGTPWDRYGKHCRAACRNQFAADFLNNFLGFRVAVTAGPP
jgi:formylglycine-generating enzyme required for sulfatase activity